MLSSLQRKPSEVSIGFAYLPPILVVLVTGVLAALFVATILNRTGLSRFFWHPPLAFLALAVLMSALVALFVIFP